MADSEDVDDTSDDGNDKRRGATTRVPALDVRFSQKKMRNVFADGKLVERSVETIRAVRLSADEAEIYGATWRLETPFPPIEIMRFQCKLRDENTGRPLQDPETGEEMFEPEESWFTLDNRRLCCLQKAAVKLLPDRCLVDAIAEVRKERRMREIRKFRTLDNGQSIMVGSVVDGVPFQRWSWRAAASTRERGRGGQDQKGKGKGGKNKGANIKGTSGSDAAADGDNENGSGHVGGGGGKKGCGKGKHGTGKGNGKSGQNGKGKGKRSKGEHRDDKSKGKGTEGKKGGYKGSNPGAAS